MRTLALVATIALIAGCRARRSAEAPMEMSAADSTDQRASAAAHHAMTGPMGAAPHLALTPLRAPTAADTARAAGLVADMRTALEKYRDVRVAESDGFRPFLPGVKQPIYHFTNSRWALEEKFRFNAAKPTSLLYRQESDGKFVLLGAMYTAPPGASFDELERRIPLGVARWHEHVNWCAPPAGQRERWRETRDGVLVFGPQSPIASAAGFAAVGGRYLPRIFGWMVHVMAFESEDPQVMWGSGHDQRHS
jgi:hypothetical protein